MLKRKSGKVSDRIETGCEELLLLTFVPFRLPISFSLTLKTTSEVGNDSSITFLSSSFYYIKNKILSP